jgi:hypothetical protein
LCQWFADATRIWRQIQPAFRQNREGEEVDEMSWLKTALCPLVLFGLSLLSTGCNGATRPPGPLPRSAKGYELYSWQVAGEPWQHTLITGTNRQKTAEELTAEGDALTDDGWAKVTVTGTEALLALLGRLPPGEQVFWRGVMATPAGAEPGQFRLPERIVVDTVNARCRELSLTLIVGAAKPEAALVLPPTPPTA